MGKRILGFFVAVVVVYLLYLGYIRWRDTHAESGEISGDTPSERVESSTPAPQPRPVQTQPAPMQTATVSAPASDSISPNPTNGMAFAGSGKFQVYRQGNLTWRVDTESGNACILFATMEEWKKPIVYSHGCNSR